MLFWVYFKKNQEKKKVVPYVLAYIVLNIAMSIFCISNLEQDRYYWKPYITHYGFVQLFFILNILYDTKMYTKRLENWKREYVIASALNQIELEELLNE